MSADRLHTRVAQIVALLLYLGVAGTLLRATWTPFPELLIVLALGCFLLYASVFIQRAALGKVWRPKIDPAGLALMVVSTLVSFGLLEVALRMGLVGSPQAVLKDFIYQQHPVANYTLLPSVEFEHATDEYNVTYTISSQNLRDRYFEEKSDDVYRILCLGDSFTFGTGVEADETYPSALQDLVDAEMEGSRTIEVINGGTVGYGLWQEYIALQEKGLDLKPDLVVLQIFPDNDVHDEMLREGRLLRAYDLDYYYFMYEFWHADPRVPLLEPFTQNSVLLSKLARRYWKLRSSAQGNAGQGRNRREASAARHWFFEIYLEPHYAQLQEAWEGVLKSAQDIAALCEKEGIELVVLNVPHSWVMIPEWVNTWLYPEPELDGATYDFRKANVLGAELAEQIDADYIDFEAYLRAAETDYAPLYFQSDGHFRPEGNRLIAQCVLDNLRKLGML